MRYFLIYIAYKEMEAEVRRAEELKQKKVFVVVSASDVR